MKISEMRARKMILALHNIQYFLLGNYYPVSTKSCTLLGTLLHTYTVSFLQGNKYPNKYINVEALQTSSNKLRISYANILSR